MRSILIHLFLLLALGSCYPLAGQSIQNKIDPELLRDAAAGNTVECIIRFRAAADLQGAAVIHGKPKKGSWVYESLRQTAALSQAHTRQLLTTHHIPFQSYLIVNAIYTRLDWEWLLRVAALPEVERLQGNPWMPIVPDRMPAEVINSGRSPVDWGLEQIGVPEVWALGIDGSGVVIGGQDTGVEWTHPTLKEQYRGFVREGQAVDHTYHWFDAIEAISPLHQDPAVDPANNPCGLMAPAPCDDNDHGTYTMGISVGDDGQDNQIGVAPGSRWIACRNMERGYGSPATYLAGFEWFLAPTDLAGMHPRPELAPHVINNSWGCPTKEGCTPENWGILDKAINNLRAAGVVVVVSAGNDGPACGSVNDPSAIFAGAFAVGATDSRDSVARFSSRGLVTVDGSGRLKPDIVAPGVRIRSARRNGQFLTASGTSAAGPFVTGLVALMIDANPDLAGEVELIEQILRETAVPAFDAVSCDGYTDSDIPNPMTGYGRIDALAAVERAMAVSVIADPDDTPPVQVYPNPGREWINFVTQQDVNSSTLEVFDATGRLVIRQSVAGLPVSIDLSQQAAGLYGWRWYFKDGSSKSGKVLKH